MKPEKNIIESIRKLLGGTISPEETKQLNSWYNSFDRAEEVVIESGESIDAVKERMQSQLLHEIGRGKKSELKLIQFTNTYWKAAAAITFFIILSSLFFYSTNILKDEKPFMVWNERTTQLGEKTEIILTDGSKIILNAGSKIKFPQKFIEDKPREVFLDGEAFFDVVHNDRLPFVVHSGNIITKDIGTKFDIKSYNNENKIVVSLVEGKVEVSRMDISKQENAEKNYLLPKQQLSYSRVNDIISIAKFNEDEAIGWLNNNLVFHNEPFEEVAKRLERNFGIKFEFPNNRIPKKELTANFQNEQFLTVAQSIKKVTGLNYKTLEQNNRTVKIIFY